MAKQKVYTAGTLLPPETVIEVIAIKGESVYKTEMTFGEALKIEKQPGWTYINYKLGTSQYQLTQNKSSYGKENI